VNFLMPQSGVPQEKGKGMKNSIHLGCEDIRNFSTTASNPISFFIECSFIPFH